MRELLREQCLRGHHQQAPQELPAKLKEALAVFDRLFAEFELSYVSAMVPVKTALEYNHQQDIVVLFSETLQRALRLRLLSQVRHCFSLQISKSKSKSVFGVELFAGTFFFYGKDSISLSDIWFLLVDSSFHLPVFLRKKLVINFW